MRISNPAIYQHLSSTVNRNQQPDRFPVKPVTIEGQLIDAEKEQSQSNTTQSFRESEQSNNETQQAELIAPTTAPLVPQTITSDPAGNSLLIQQKLNGNPATFSQNESLSATPNFPYGHRRSSEGLAGGSLVIQKYLNNELPALNQSDNSQRNIDFFI